VCNVSCNVENELLLFDRYFCFFICKSMSNFLFLFPFSFFLFPSCRFSSYFAFYPCNVIRLVGLIEVRACWLLARCSCTCIYDMFTCTFIFFHYWIHLSSICHSSLLMVMCSLAQLFDCINGASTFVELWTCMSWHLCFEEKERSPKSCLSEPVRRRWLGTALVL
jgi:hypothetical protein